VLTVSPVPRWRVEESTFIGDFVLTESRGGLLWRWASAARVDPRYEDVKAFETREDASGWLLRNDPGNRDARVVEVF